MCAAVVVNETGEILALVLVGLGIVWLTSLVFLEAGLSEDRDRAREARRAARPKHPDPPRRPSRGLVRPRRRGH